MDSDFHYYGTGTAALAAGFSEKDSITIANVAQYHDWFHSDYWSYWYIVDDKGKKVKDSSGNSYHYEYPQLTSQNLDWKMIADYNGNIWTPFHFPPGNVKYTVDGSDAGAKGSWKSVFNAHHIVQKTRLDSGNTSKLCRPFSRFAMDMIEDTVKQYNELSGADGDELANKISALVAPRRRCPVTDGRKLAIYLLGIRLHVLSDTWAHQDFTGSINKEVNGAGLVNDVYIRDENGEYRLASWTGTIYVFHDDTDSAAAPNVIKNPGHGQLGHLPDYSWAHFKYPASWLPEEENYHIRDNPGEYKNAWSWLSHTMKLCRGDLTDDQIQNEPAQPPQDISKVIETYHPLSTKALTAVPASEELWKKTALGKKLPERWIIEEREKLGLHDGLASTRYGWINVRQNSTLHCMETAAAIHYQFCVDWAAKHNDNGYSWTLWKPIT
ncbi:MAG: hypothetical protein MI799_12190 [Desulfobacterales bacterium]|nr:hypothetical protein [Desulfobacterales bacterium]